MRDETAQTGAQSTGKAQPPAWPRRFLNAIDERLGIGALAYPVPAHANSLAWSLGGVTATAFGILVLSGILLVQFYSPTPETANQSVRAIATGVWGGDVLRGVHFWAAQAMYVTAALHLIRVFVTGSFKRPREGNWLIGVVLFGLTTLALFTGTVLKWDQEGFEALGHNVEVGDLLGGAGFWFSADFANQVSILVRLYGAHTVILPGALLVLTIWHGLLVKRHRISPHPLLPADRSGEQAAREEPSEPFTHHLRRVAAFGLVLLGIVGILAVLLPPPIGATPVAGIELTRPPWNFWWLYTLENWFGLPAILFAEVALFTMLAAVPFLDRSRNRWWRRRPIPIVVGAVLLTAIVTLTVLILFIPIKAHLGA